MYQLEIAQRAKPEFIVHRFIGTAPGQDASSQCYLLGAAGKGHFHLFFVPYGLFKLYMICSEIVFWLKFCSSHQYCTCD